MTELETKLNQIDSLLKAQGLEALLLQKVSSFAWATCGAASYVNTAATDGAASLLITPQGRYVLTNNIEATRIEQEEQLAAQGWEIRAGHWYAAQDAVGELTGKLKLGADGPFPGAKDLSGELARLRANLNPQEGERFRQLGQLCAQSMDQAIRAVEPGMTEYQIAGLLAQEAQSRGVQPIVDLIATDERIFKFRHPLPTDKKMERYAMLILCGRRWGLVCSLTRLIYFGRLPSELRSKSLAVAKVDATIIDTTHPGRTMGEIFTRVQSAYAEVGYPDEWKLHHQGGTAGYEAREYLATPGGSDVVNLGQAYAWNPSITGTKSEDTVLVGAKDNEILTRIPGWPVLTVQVGDKQVERPAILEMV
jgi:Xaa-Pro aminopeptidase